MKRILIVGCGRSGTRYTSKVLRSCGLSIGHEAPGKDGMVSWKSIVNTSEIASHDVIYHQVRHPLDVIASFHTAMESTWEFIREWEPSIKKDDSLLLQCMKYYLYWNLRCEEHADTYYQVENLSFELPLMLKDIGVDIEQDMRDAIDDIPKDDHSRAHGTLTWGDLEKENSFYHNQILRLSKHHGY